MRCIVRLDTSSTSCSSICRRADLLRELEVGARELRRAARHLRLQAPLVRAHLLQEKRALQGAGELFTQRVVNSRILDTAGQEKVAECLVLVDERLEDPVAAAPCFALGGGEKALCPETSARRDAARAAAGARRQDETGPAVVGILAREKRDVPA